MICVIPFKVGGKMSEAITIELPETLVNKVKEIAMLNHRNIEEMLIEWIDRAVNDVPIESLPNEQILALCNLQMSAQQQDIFSDLQARSREEQLNQQETNQLNELMQIYRCGLVQKAQAINVAVKRGLIPTIISQTNPRMIYLCPGTT
jgi:hypothetical protein